MGQVLTFIATHWDTLGLIITNIAALLVKTPVARYEIGKRS